ncbi:hypothetical protein EDB19DRAFT_1897859 [Suillus lakei]|nr:hypothetical protein EDB19DRAFT_1897859 [Suillus lakei]
MSHHFANLIVPPYDHQFPRVPYRPYLKKQFSSAYDTFLEIIHHVNQRLRGALKWDTVNWCLLNSCPACFYKLDDEPTLRFEWLVSIDGNNSLKRWDSTIYGTTAQSDSRTARSDYWIHASNVDKFQDEVNSRQTDTKSDDDWHDEPTDTNLPGAFSCVNWWRNAGPETRKKMFAVFEESGIFITSCQHHFILLTCDMIQSGKLSKYPLAIIDNLLTVYGRNGGCAYDIGCTFSKTLTNSTLSPRMHSLGFRMMVGVFHGHAHNQRCQLDWHPMYILGTGHTEGEGCEHIFSASNELARSTRHANHFHRHQAIEEHFAFWDANKYAALTELETIKAELHLSDDDFLGFFDQEHVYLDSLKQPAPRDQLSIHYVVVLDELAERSLLSVDERWVICGEEYNHLKEEAALSKYCAALDELECLVVMRLFKLLKLSLSGTGYKLCQQISKALQRRSEAICNAINWYNTQATSLIPPRPKIMWKDIADYTFLGKFDLLPAHCEATTKYFKLCRAREEIIQLNIEIRQLQTAIHNEAFEMSAIINDLVNADPLLASKLKHQWHSQAAINAVHIYQLDQIETV